MLTRRICCTFFSLSCFSLSWLAAGLSAQAVIGLEPDKDNTLYETALGNVSNAKGQFLFTGRVGFLGGGLRRRALLRFDVPGCIPKGSKIQGVTLRMTMDRTPSLAPSPHGLHRLTADWGEGTSKASGQEGSGAAATTGDATWTHRFFNTQRWTTTGGDFAATPSATTNVAGNGNYTWGSTAAMVADVQGWLDTPAQNFGWIVLGNETTTTTAKRWGSRENLLTAARPLLTVRFQPKAGVKPIGEGCPDGNGRKLTHGANGVPSVGNTAFALVTTNGTPATPAVMFLAGGLQDPPIPLNANKCFLYLNIFALGPGFGAAFDASGRTTWPVPIPANNALVGVGFETQVFAIEPNLSLRSSNALNVLIGT